MSNAIRAQNLLKANELGTINLLKEMKAVKGSKKTSCNLPDNVAGVSGEQLIVEEFRSVYSALYNSIDTTDQMSELKAQLNSLIGPDAVDEADLITGQIVKKAATRMKPDNSDVRGSIIMQYPAKYFIHAPVTPACHPCLKVSPELCLSVFQFACPRK